MSIALYSENLKIALSQYNVEILVKIWYDAAFTGKEGRRLRQRIKKALPDLYAAHGVTPSVIFSPRYWTFRQFVEERKSHSLE